MYMPKLRLVFPTENIEEGEGEEEEVSASIVDMFPIGELVWREVWTRAEMGCHSTASRRDVDRY